MTTAVLMWRPGVVRIDAGLAASIALDRAGWQAAGARFTQVDDNDGERPWLAVGEVELDGVSREFGVLVYDDDEVSHLLVDGSSGEREARTRQITSELLATGAVPSRQAVLEIIGA